MSTLKHTDLVLALISGWSCPASDKLSGLKLQYVAYPRKPRIDLVPQELTGEVVHNSEKCNYWPSTKSIQMNFVFYLWLSYLCFQPSS